MSHDFPIPRQDHRQDGQPDGEQPGGGTQARPDGPRDPGPVSTPDSRSNAAGADHPVDGRADGTGVVEWGQPAASRPRRPWPSLAGLNRDGRVVPVIAGLGAVGVFASLVDEWVVIHVPDGGGTGPGSQIRLANGVAEVPTFGPGYAVGLLGLLGCLALVLFGAPGVRHNARVAGLAVTGGVLALLVATTLSVDTFSDRWVAYGEIEGLRTEQGRGLLMAYLGTAALGLALLLAGRFVGRPAAPAAAPATTADPAADGPVDWPWHRPRPAAAPEPADGAPAPIDLTVTAATPFIRPDQQHPR